MGYKAVFSRREGGGYDAAYGRGSKKLTATIERVPSNGWTVWAVTGGLGLGSVDPSPRVSEVKAAWAKFAEERYATGLGMPRTTLAYAMDGDGGKARREAYANGAAPPPAADAPADPAAPAPCPPPPRIGPPTLKVEPTCPTCGMHLHGWRNGLPPCRCAMPRGPEYIPDPFDPRMWDRVPAPDGGGENKHLSEFGALDLIYNWMLEYRDYVAPEGRLLAPWCHVRAVLQRKLGYAEYRDGVLGPSAEGGAA